LSTESILSNATWCGLIGQHSGLLRYRPQHLVIWAAVEWDASLLNASADIEKWGKVVKFAGIKPE
jgi:hypothetical protein